MTAGSRLHILNLTIKLSNPRQEKVSGCGSVSRAVASNAKGPRFESSHQQTLISDIYLFNINGIKMTKIVKKRPGMAQFFVKKSQ